MQPRPQDLLVFQYGGSISVNEKTLSVRKTIPVCIFLPKAALAAALATLGSTTEARNATVDIMGFPC